MSDHIYAKKAAQQKTLLPSRSNLLQPRRSLMSSSTPVQENVPPVNSHSRVASRFGFDFSRIPLYPLRRAALQAKLKVNRAGDTHEREADQAAERGMHMTSPETSAPDNAKEFLMRKQTPMPAAAGTATDILTVPSSVHDTLNSRGGQPLDTPTRAFMEPRFGHDFSQVRVHTDERAAESARAMNSLAYTVGRDVVFGQGQYAPTTTIGQRLLAHELTHVVQQTNPSWMKSPTASSVALSSASPTMIQAKEDTKSTNPIEDILPPKVGLVESIDRYLLLVDLFGEDALDKVVKEIRANEAAKKLVRKEGIVAIVALIDTRGPNELDPVKAETALKKHKELYQRSLLIKHTDNQEKSFLFQDKPPAKKDTSSAKEEEPVIESASSKSREPFVEPVSFKVGEVAVRISHLRGEWRADEPTPQMKRARDIVLHAVAQVLKDLNELPPAPNLTVRREDERTRARLKEAFRAFGDSRPLHIFVAPLSIGEMLGQVPLSFKTDQVFVTPEDIGDPAKLQAAIRVPLITLVGGSVGLSKKDEARTPDEIKEGLLHEAVHALLITRGMAANQLWESIKSKLVEGPPTVKQRCEEVVHRYLLAQEESFVYENVGKIYSGFVKNKDVYDAYIQAAEVFFASKAAKFGEIKKTLDVKERVAKHKVDWSISFKHPKSLIVDANDITTLNALLMLLPG